MPNAVRARAAGGDRAPGLIDSSVTQATHFFYSNGASLNFDGTDEVVVGPSMDSLGLTFTNKISVGVWVKWSPFDSPDNYQGIANASSNWTFLNDGWGLYWTTANDLRFFINQYNTNYANFANADPVTSWHFMVGVYDGTLGSDNILLYVDAAINGAAGTYSDNITGQTANVELGRTANTNTDTTDYAVGHMDELGIWNTALSAAEVTALYNSGAPVSLLENAGNYTSAGSLALWWRCGDLDDSNTPNGINDAAGRGNPGTMTNMEDIDIDTETYAGG